MRRMTTRVSRRFAAWLALAATVGALAWPAHAAPTRPSFAGGDLCVGGKVLPAAPAGGGADHACDACCASSGSALTSSATASTVVAFPAVRVTAAGAVRRATAERASARARAPPA